MRAKQAAVVVAGLALGLGAISVFEGRGATGNGTAPYQPQPASITEFAFPTTVLDAPPAPPEAIPTLATEPPTVRAAVTAFLQPLADGHPELAYPLLDQASRRRYPTLASWIRAQADRAAPVTFTVGAARTSPDRPGAYEVDLAATHVSSLDPIRGFVPGRSTSVWLVRDEAEGWRVSADALTFRPILPAEAGATDVVQRWVSLLAACDAPAAVGLQVTANLYGPSTLSQAPCATRGTWAAGPPTGLDRTPDPRAFLAAFGPEVGTWARLVPVQGPESRFLAAVAPVGDGWQVMGVAIDGQ